MRFSHLTKDDHIPSNWYKYSLDKNSYADSVLAIGFSWSGILETYQNKLHFVVIAGLFKSHKSRCELSSL